MTDTYYSLSDIASLLNGRNDGFGGDGLGWLILIFLFFGAMGGGYGNRGGAPVDVATQTGVQNAVNNQAINNGLNQIALSSANNNYETAQLIQGQTNTFLQQGYTNQINAIQGFNSVNQTLQGGFDNVAQQINQLGYQMDQCCCSIKTQMLQDRLDDRNRELGVAQSALNNASQTQNILSALGRFVAWEGSGTATSSAS